MNKNPQFNEILAKALSQNKLRPCPWCKKVPKIQLTDDEGNFRSESYLDDSYSGVGYALVHMTEDPDDKCPIATVDEETILGGMIYDTEEEAIDAWNRREGD